MPPASGLEIAERATPAPTPAVTPMNRSRARIAGLDGIRGLAALFVVVNHIFLRAFPGYPVNHAPAWAAGFIYGRFAVVIFIVVSGFSLSVSAARSGWRLGGVARFAHRRAWRILPPYWAALGFSLLMTWFVVAQPGLTVPTGRSVAVNGLLVQDVVAAPSPNRAFWSIAIEVQLYVVFPLLVLAMRRLNAYAMLTAIAAPVLTLGVCAAAHVASAGALVTQYTPDLAVLFAIGIAAAGIVTATATATERRRSLPWNWFALALAVPVTTLIAWQGSAWTIRHYFWVDLAWGPAIGALIAAVATGRPKWLLRMLDLHPLRALGSFSYSLYLTHAPIVIAVYYGLVQGRVRPGVPTFLVMCGIVVPLTVGFARLFATVFELPFQRRRGWDAVRDMLHRRAQGACATTWRGRVGATTTPPPQPARSPS
jgi:peptidoglycan/LPS O-acetylase OafA/YrhL